ncbi:MAG: nucleotidyltransferase family protein, partial [Burkholderiaceae bacterium]
CHAGRRGHPVGFAAALGAELIALTGEAGAREVLARHPPQSIEVKDAGVLLDVDTP